MNIKKHVKNYFSWASIIALVLQFFVGVVPTYAATSGNTGYLPAARTISNSGWDNPDNAFSLNEVSAVANSMEDVAVYGNFGLSIPTNGTVEGLAVKVNGNDSSSGERQAEISLSWNGANWTNSKTPISPFTTVKTDRFFGGLTDKWGHTWSSSEISNLTLKIKALPANNGGANKNLYVDQISVIVYYSTPDVIPTITIGTYDGVTPTNQDISVTASTDVGSLSATSHTFSENGSFTFTATNGTATSSKTVTINNIDKIAPTGVVSYDKNILTNTDVVATLTPSEPVVISSIGGDKHTFTENGTHEFIFSDAAGNTGSSVASVDWIDKTSPTTLISVTGGTVGNDGWYIGSTAPEISLTSELGASIYWRYGDDAFVGGASVQYPGVSDGIHELEYYSVDLATNEETPHKTATVKYDSTAPTITLNGDSIIDVVYGDDYIEAGAIATDAIDGDLSELINISGSVNTLVIGTHVLNYDVVDTAGNVASTVVRTINVIPREITVAADAGEKVYGEADPELTFIMIEGDLVEGDEFIGELNREVGEDVGIYAINPGTLTLGDNYNLTFIGDNFEITPAEITVTADTKTKVVGAADPALTYQISSGALVDGDVFTGTLARVAGESVGSYAINQGNLKLNDNYALTYKGSVFTITAVNVPAVLGTTTTIASNNLPTVTYDDNSGEVLAAETEATSDPVSVKSASTSSKSSDKKSQSVFSYTFLGVYDWIWLLVAIIAVAAWWFATRDREEE